ncbi:MAG: XdhC family protein [Proteobacteria bacterium]|nr:XdhC family protein [Pseudomonadota bacterium]
MKIWHEIKHLLEQGRSLYLLTVVESSGSAPGRVGFKMLVSNCGYLVGSIGGGIMEFNLVEKARKLLKEQIVDHHIVIQDHRGSSEPGNMPIKFSSGMICSGSQTIAFNYLTQDDLGLISACIQAPVMVDFSHKGLCSVAQDISEVFSMNSSGVWSYIELINTKAKSKAHIFGAGHVSLPTSELLSSIGFDVCLYDNREGLNTFYDNNFSSLKKIIDYQQVLQQVNIEKEDFVVLMTHKFTEDKLILSQLLDLECQYIGVLGSKNKIKVMFNALIKAGEGEKQAQAQAQLNNIYAPIGLSIHSQTTQEIAISIVAEIIKVRNNC